MKNGDITVKLFDVPISKDEMDNFCIKTYLEIERRITEETDKKIMEIVSTIAKDYGIKKFITINENNVVNAFNKQIPQTPVAHGVRPGREVNSVSYTCPECHEHIGRDKFCKHCGQALLW